MIKKIWPLLFGLALICITVVPAVSQTTGLMVGTVLEVKDGNSMVVNITASNVPGIYGTTLIFLPHPYPMEQLMYFQGKQLSFNLLGYDIQGIPICNAYYNGISIDYFEYYALMNLNEYYFSPYYYYDYYYASYSSY